MNKKEFSKEALEIMEYIKSLEHIFVREDEREKAGGGGKQEQEAGQEKALLKDTSKVESDSGGLDQEEGVSDHRADGQINCKETAKEGILSGCKSNKHENSNTGTRGGFIEPVSRVVKKIINNEKPKNNGVKASGFPRLVDVWEIKERGKNVNYKNPPGAIFPILFILFAWNKRKPFKVASYTPEWLLDKLEKFYGYKISRRTLNNYMAYMEREGFISRKIRKGRTSDGKVRKLPTLVKLEKKGMAIIGGLVKMVARGMVWCKEFVKRFRWAMKNEVFKFFEKRYVNEFLYFASKRGIIEALDALPT